MQNLKEKTFGPNERQLDLAIASNKEFDLIVVGGGITGAGIALDASLRGLSVLLVEKSDFASGTSSKSTKLIHGGLRYLKQFEFGLVRETGLERRVTHVNIPHLVHPETMLLPIVENGEFTKTTASLAIFVYDYLAKVVKKDKKRNLSKTQFQEKEPLINQNILKSGVSYSEYRTDDARLTIEIIKAARREGALCFNYMKVEEFLYEKDEINGIQCEDQTNTQRKNFKAKIIVSAAGPWVDKLRENDKSLNNKRLHLTKGVHIVIPKEKFPLNNSMYFDDFDGRMIFAIPRGKVTYVGTTDTEYSKDLDRVLCRKKDASYLVDKVNHFFPSLNLVEDDIISSWAGLRPLIHEEGKSPSELSRKDEIFVSKTGLISIAGGKLTGFRKMSKKIVDKVIKQEKTFPKVKCKTKKYKIHSDSFKDYSDYKQHISDLFRTYKNKGLNQYNAWYLVTNYGKHAEKILQTSFQLNEPDFDQALIKCEIQFCILYESAMFPWDYFNRRSGRIYFDIQSVNKYFGVIHEEFEKYFKWKDAKIKEIRDKSKQLIKDVTSFKAI